MEKLQELCIQSLEQRRVRFDLIQTFEILRGYDKVEKGTWFTLVGSDVTRQTRMTSYKDNLVPTHSRTDLSRNFFSNRIANLWNNLPTEIKDAKSLNIFKSLLDAHL